MKAFLSSLSRSKRYVVAELFLVYFAHGLSSIMLGSVLPDLRAAYALDYQIGGTLLSAQSIGYLGIGLLSGLAAINGDSNARTSSCIMYSRSALSCC